MVDKPYSFVVPDSDWAFIHITKTGGASVRRYLKMPQVEETKDGFGRNVHVMRFENLESELTAFARNHQLNCLASFPHINSSSCPEGFKGGYTPAMRDMVREMFQEDFERFGYPMYL